MPKRLVKWLTLGLAALVGVAVAGWYLFLKSYPEPRATIRETPTVPTAAPSAGTTSSLDGTYSVKPGSADSFVGYRVTEKLVANVVQTTATGRTNNVTGTFTISGTSVSDVTVTADLRTLRSDSDLRDGRIRDSGLESNRFPQAKFVLTTPLTLPHAPAVGETLTVDAGGAFTLHGVTRPITVPVQARWDGRAIQVVARVPIVFGDYDIAAPSSPLVASVDDHGEMELQLFFQKS
jgi:polyisoprenoid-binding protein YceI